MKKNTQAFEQGKKAFENKINAPVLDKEFMATLPSDFKTRIKLYKEWSKGWACANIETALNS